MYHWIEDKEFLGKMRSLCSGIVNELVQYINSDGKLKVKAYLVGSGAKNIETQNNNEAVDLDYNLEIVKAIKFDINDGTGIKEYIRKAFNVILSNNNWSDCEDSTSALQTKKRHFTSGNHTEFSIDVAIVKRDGEDKWHRLIHEKTGNVSRDRWYWNLAPDSKGLDARVKKLKDAHKWNIVRETYLNKKNMYLSRSHTEEQRASFNIYIEAVNEEYAKLSKTEPKTKKPKPPKKAVTQAAPKKKTPTISDKMLFNNEIQQRLAKSKQYTNDIICAVASACGLNYSGKKNKKSLHNELVQKYGQKQGDAIYQRIAPVLK